MDNLAWFIFIADLSNSIKNISSFIFFFLLAGIAILCLFLFITLHNYTYGRHNKDDKIKVISYKKYIKICVLLCLCFGFLNLAFPSTKTLAAMYILPRIANNEDIQHTVNDNIKSLRLLSEKWLMELIHGDDKKEGK